MKIADVTLAQASRDISSGSISPVDLAEAFFDRIDKLNPKLTAYTLLLKEKALKQAEKAEKEIKQGKRRGPLHGIPLSIKDNIWIKGFPTTAGSKLLAGWVPEYDAAVVERLSDAGAVILGKTNLHEWAKGSSTLNPFYGHTKNPWDISRVPGGSSGGSASAVAASLCLGSLGTDAAGSVRMPASLCGTVGLKPTFARIPHYGVVDGSGSWSLDTIGILTKTSEDAAFLLEALAGPDERDKGSVGLPPLGKVNLNHDLKGLEIGVIKDHFFDICAEEVKKGVEAAVRVFEKLGASVDEVKLPHIRKAPFMWATISRVEAWAAHEKTVRSSPQGYSRGILTRILLGQFIGAHYYLKAQRARAILIKEFEDAFKKLDFMITPATPLPAPTIDDHESGYLDVDGRKVEVGGIYSFLARCTIPINLTGHPAVSTLSGFSKQGVPLGLQIIGKAFQENKILAVSHQFEKATGYVNKHPSL
ncbi:MAG: Asp-tRNA(Asn)/Glu-tRNA(Gln) amidotransferase subunit GatA [Thaumarchaeota archaeon]|nr:Asp-tRNA(Asn)/Glu-tRNA(Gln) amidotransferase subunit GatA [Nitrososphaerota archaeon]